MRLLENKFDDAIVASPQHKKAIEQLANSTLERPAKYLTWFIRQLNRHEPLDEILSLLTSFESNAQRLKEKDINTYATLGDLRAGIEALGATNREVCEKAKEGAIKIFDGSKAYVYYIPTKEASQYYGKGTKWCIAATESHNYFSNYNSGCVFFFVLAKQTKSDKYDKVALQYDRQNHTLKGFWTADDQNQGKTLSRTLLLQAVLGVSRPELLQLLKTIQLFLNTLENKTSAAAEVRAMSDRELFRLPVDKAIEYAKAIVDDLESQTKSDVLVRLADANADDSRYDIVIAYMLQKADPELVLAYALKSDVLDIELFEDYFVAHPGVAADSFFAKIPGVDIAKYKASLKAAQEQGIMPQGMKYVRQLLSKKTAVITQAIVDQILAASAEEIVKCMRLLVKRSDVNSNPIIVEFMKRIVTEKLSESFLNWIGHSIGGYLRDDSELLKSDVLAANEQIIDKLFECFWPDSWYALDPSYLIERTGPRYYQKWCKRAAGYITTAAAEVKSGDTFLNDYGHKKATAGFKQLIRDIYEYIPNSHPICITSFMNELSSAEVEPTSRKEMCDLVKDHPFYWHNDNGARGFGPGDWGGEYSTLRRRMLPDRPFRDWIEQNHSVLPPALWAAIKDHLPQAED